MFDIYIASDDNRCRYALGSNGDRKLLVIGLNPSTATKEKSDNSITKVERVASNHGFDGFVMLNLYPVRATQLAELDVEAEMDIYEENLRLIDQICSQQANPVVWLGWGDSIFKRCFFLDAAIELFSMLKVHGISWQHFGELTQGGHPRHPSRLNYSWKFSNLELQSYVELLARQQAITRARNSWR